MLSHHQNFDFVFFEILSDLMEAAPHEMPKAVFQETDRGIFLIQKKCNLKLKSYIQNVQKYMFWFIFLLLFVHFLEILRKFAEQEVLEAVDEEVFHRLHRVRYETKIARKNITKSKK